MGRKFQERVTDNVVSFIGTGSYFEVPPDKVVDDDILPSNKRHKEILNYLRKRFNYEINYPNFVILDDDDFGFNSELTLKGHHVKTFAGEYNFIPDDAQGFNTTKLTEALYIMKSLI